MTDAIDVSCAGCGTPMRVVSLSGRLDERPTLPMLGQGCSSCGADFCEKCLKIKLFSRKAPACPSCGTPRAVDRSLWGVDSESIGRLDDVSCALCSEPIPNERFLSIAEWETAGLKSKRIAGRRCHLCGSVFCEREKEGLGVIVDLQWPQTPCPTCGVVGGLTSIAVSPELRDIPDRVAETLDRLMGEQWATSATEREEVLARLDDHGEIALEVSLYGERRFRKGGWRRSTLQVARMVEVGATGLVGKPEIEQVILLTSDEGATAADGLDGPHRALARIAKVTGNQRALDALTELLVKAKLPATRAVVAYYLGFIGGDQARTALTGALEDTGVFDRSDVDELQQTFGAWFAGSLINPMQIGVKHRYQVADVARLALDAMGQPPTPTE